MTDRRTTVVIVDATGDDHAELIRALEDAGFSATHLDSAVTQSFPGSSDVDVVLLDPVDYPGDLDGLITRLAASSVPLILFSSAAAGALSDRYLTLGAAQFLSQSSAPADVVINVRLLLRGRAALLEEIERSIRLDAGLASLTDREKLIGIYMREFQAPAAEIKSLITRFSRNRNIRIRRLSR